MAHEILQQPFGLTVLSGTGRPPAASANRASSGHPLYDPELIYVECRICGKPVLWEPGKTTELLRDAGVDPHDLDERCLIISEGCPNCRPEELRGFSMAVVRIAGLTPEEAAYMSRPAGNS